MGQEQREKGKLLFPGVLGQAAKPLASTFKAQGYTVVDLGPVTEEDITSGLGHVDNDVCAVTIAIVGQLVRYLKENGKFEKRADLKKVPKLGPKAYEQCAGFLRVYGGSEPLDTTSIHPESYPAAKAILKATKIDIQNDSVSLKEAKLEGFDLKAFSAQYGVGEETLHDIVEEIKRPGRDLRDDMKIVELNQEAKDIKDLKPGMILNGTVRNIMDFGMFVDINVHQDGLVHISELYSIGDVVKVKVLSVDVEKKRIGLSIKQVSAE